MSQLHESKSFWFVGTAVSVIFITLILFRIDFFERFRVPPEKMAMTSPKRIPDRDSYMNIFQSNTKIGYSHASFTKEEGGYHLKETVFMRINTLGTIQDIHIDTDGWLNPDYSISSFVFSIQSGLFDFSVQGTVAGKILTLQTKSAGGETRKFELAVPDKPFLMSGVVDAVAAAQVQPGDEFRFDVFDPATMGQAPVMVRILSKDQIRIMGQERSALRASLGFKGSTQEAWIGEDGEILKEAGLLGITLVKTTQKDALTGISSDPGKDLTQQASVNTRVKLDHPERLKNLKIKIDGIQLQSLQVEGGRQHLIGKHLVITKENIDETDETLPSIMDRGDLKRFLQPTPFIQSDHQKIRAVTVRILGSNDTTIEKGRKLVAWVFKNIHKRPVLSLPDALSTLENRVGDCNEHAVLLAALARSARIPAKIETGLVYLKGRFYYHAWNSLYLNEWITADAVFGQIPADVTHIRLTSGDQKEQLDLMQVIGKIELQIVEAIEK